MTLRLPLAILFVLVSFTLASAAGFQTIWTDGNGAYRNGARLTGAVATSDGENLYTLDDKNLRLWEVNTGAGIECVTIKFPGQGPFFSTDGKYLIYVSHQQLQFVDVATGNITFTRAFERDDPSTVWSDGSKCVVGTKGGKVWTGEIGLPDTWKPAMEDDDAPGTLISQIQAFGDGKFALIFGQKIAVYDSSFKKLWGDDQTGNGLYSCHFITSRGKDLLIGVGFRRVVAYNPTTGTKDTSMDVLQGVTAAATDGVTSYLAFLDNRIGVYDFGDGPLERTSFKSSTPQYGLMHISGNRLVGFDLRGDWRVWDTSGKALGQPGEVKGTVISVAWGKASGSNWVAVSRETGITVYSDKDGSPLPTSDAYKPAAMLLKPLSDGKLLSVYYGRRIAVYDPAKASTVSDIQVSVLPLDVVLGSGGLPVYIGSDRLVHSVTALPEKEGLAAAETIVPLPKARFWKFGPRGDLVIQENARHMIGLAPIAGGEVVYLGSHETGEDKSSALIDVSVYKDSFATIASGSLMLWSFSGKQAISPFIKLKWDPVRVAMLDDERAAVAFPNGTIQVYGRSGNMLSEWTSPVPVTALCGSANGLIAGMVDSTVFHFRVE